MGDFAIKGWPLWFAIIFGFALYVMNFALLFVDSDKWEWWVWVLVVAFTIGYVCL